MESSDQEELALALAAASDQDAFDALYRRYVARVYRFMVTRVGNAADADDLTSQTFLAAFIDIGCYRGCAPFAAWLFGIACHRLASYFRSQRESVPLDEADALPCPMPPIDAQVHMRLEVNRVLQAMDRLTPERGEALRLRIFGELSCAEVAQVMDRSNAAVKMLIHRAIKDLRHALEADSADGDNLAKGPEV
jgi:RNA polymerase sigma-70 factor (ECF subfamily)